MVIAMQYANKSVDKCLLQRLSTSYRQWWFIALPHEEKWKQVIPVSWFYDPLHIPDERHCINHIAHPQRVRSIGGVYIHYRYIRRLLSVCCRCSAADRWPGEAREPARKRNVSVVTVSRDALKPLWAVVYAVAWDDLSTYPEARSSKQIHEWSTKDPLKIPISLQTLSLMGRDHDHISCGMLLINCNMLMISCIQWSIYWSKLMT